MEEFKIYKIIDPNPKNPKFQFTLRGTDNWLHGYNKIVEKHNEKIYEETFTKEKEEKYNNSDLAEPLSQLMFSLNHITALRTMKDIKDVAISRVATISWYYGIYHAAKLMCALKKSSKAINHAATAAEWGKLFAKSLGEIKSMHIPYGFRIDNLIKKNIDAKVLKLSNGESYNLQKKPESYEESIRSFVSKISGHATWKREDIEKKIKKKEEIKNFRTKKNQEIRDKRLKNEQLGFGFLDVIYGHRLTCNYNESLYMLYGETVSQRYQNHLQNLFRTSYKFFEMACFFANKKLGDDLWQKIKKDIYKECPRHNLKELL